MNYKKTYNNRLRDEILGFGTIEREYKRLEFVNSVECVSES